MRLRAQAPDRRSSRHDRASFGRSVLALCVCLGVLALTLFGGRPAAAQGTIPDKASAEALFDEGLRLLDEGKLDEACARLEQSEAIDHGIGTMLYLAECYEQKGRSASAWALFRQAGSLAAASGQRARADSAARRAAQLEPTLSRLSIRPAQALPGMVIARDDTILPESLWGVALPVDPGAHRITVSAPGHHSWTTQVDVSVHDARASITVPRLAPKPAEAEASAQRGKTQRVTAWILGGLGSVSLAVSAGFGGFAIYRDRQARSHCEGTVCRDEAGERYSERAVRNARVSNYTALAGGVLLATGLVIYLLAPESDSPRVSLSTQARGATLHVGGSF